MKKSDVSIKAEVGTVQEFVKQRLSSLGRTQQWLATEAKIDVSYLSRFLRWNITISLEQLSNWSKAFAGPLGCHEADISLKIPVTIDVYRHMKGEVSSYPKITEREKLNKDMLRTLSEYTEPTNSLLAMLQRVQGVVDFELDYAVCKKLISLSKKAMAQKK